MIGQGGRHLRSIHQMPPQIVERRYTLHTASSGNAPPSNNAMFCAEPSAKVCNAQFCGVEPSHIPD